MDRRLAQQEATIRGELNSTIRVLKMRIGELEAQAMRASEPRPQEG